KDTIWRRGRSDVQCDDDGCNLFEPATRGGPPMALYLIGTRSNKHFALDENTPSFFIEYPAIRDATPLTLVLARLILAGILLFEHEEIVCPCGDVHLHQLNEKPPEQTPILVECSHQRMRDPVLWLRILVKYVSQAATPTIWMIVDKLASRS